ncbi:hypothetical protein A5784_08480 [Mycobacterium sp. 852013-50091_SCH5140682]|nr:hypothetical protein A5784_08480 [Mycobacterium sp. 852013-50091_SCH5140682]
MNRVDRPVRWRRSELAWGLANIDIHGLGEPLERLTLPAVDPAGDEAQTYIITVSAEEVEDAVFRVNDWLADRPQSAATDAPHGFQRALSIPPRGPEGGLHDALSDSD